MMIKRNFITKLVLITGCSLCLFTMGNSVINVSAKTYDNESVVETNITEEGQSTRGLLTKLTLGLDGENGEIIASVHNDFTLGFSTVEVYVELYSSSSYTTDFSDMTLEKQGHIDDLNIYETLQISTSTNGEQKYWKARAQYRLDDGNWNEKYTITCLYDSVGNLIT